MTLWDPTKFAAIALGSVGTVPEPDGNHLRWGFLPELGFPADGFIVYRRPPADLQSECLDLSLADVGQIYSGSFAIGSFSFETNDSVSVLDDLAPTGSSELFLARVESLTIRLPRACVEVRINCHQKEYFQVGAYSGAVLVDEVSAAAGRSSLVLAADHIDRLEIKAARSRLLDLCLARFPDEELREPTAHGWEKLSEQLTLPASFSEGEERILADPDVIERAYAEWLETAVQIVSDPGRPDPVERRSLHYIDGESDPVPAGTDSGGRQTFTINQLGQMLLAALEPPMARFMGLAFVDQTAEVGRPYDYMIVGHWASGGAGSATEDYAAIVGSVVAEPAPELASPTGLRGEGFATSPASSTTTGLGVGVRWSLPPARGAKLIAQSAVSYDISGMRLANADEPEPEVPGPAVFPSTSLNEDFKIIVTRRRNSDSTYSYPVHFYSQDNLAEGWYAYRVRGQDIFGRVSDWSLPTLTRLLDTIAPPAPHVSSSRRGGTSGATTLLPIQARYLQPGDPELTADDRDLLAGHGGGPLTIVEWDWLRSQHEIAPDVTEFRIYKHSFFESTERHIASVGSVSSGSGAQVTVMLDSAVSFDAVGAHLTCRSGTFHVTNQAGATLTLRMSKVNNTAPASSATEAPKPGPATITQQSSAPRLWDERKHVEAVRADPVGPYKAVLEGEALRPTETVPVVTAWIGVTSADSRSYVLDDPARSGSLSGRPGNESSIASRAQIHARHLAPPGRGPKPSGPTFATRADFYGKSRYKLNWVPKPALKYHVLRSVESTVTAIDLDLRLRRAGHYSSEPPFGDDAAFFDWLSEEFPTLSETQFMSSRPSRLAREARAAWSARFYHRRTFSNTRLAAIAGRDGVEAAFVKLTPEPLSAAEFEDEFDGLISGRYLYRTQAVAPNGLSGPLSPVARPVSLHNIVPPATPVISNLEVADRSIVVRWSIQAASEIDHYEVYRVTGAPGALVSLSAPDQTIDVRELPQLSDLVDGSALDFADVGVLPGVTYSYTLVAVDAAGNRSKPAAPKAVRAIALSGPPAPETSARRVEASGGSTASDVAVEWSTSELNARTLVQRRIAGTERWEARSSWLKPSVRSFTDADTPADATLEYRVTLLDGVGHRSPASAIQQVDPV